MNSRDENEIKHNWCTRAIVVLVVMNLALMWSCWSAITAVKEAYKHAPNCPVILDKDNDHTD